MRYINYVNIRMGTASVPRFSNGNTLPYTQLPWAMAGFVPQTDGNGGGWFFHPDAHAIEGIRLTHQPSPWIGDYGTFLMTPQAERIYEKAGDAWSGYRPNEAVYRPDFLSIRFLRQRCTFDLTPTERGGIIRLHFDELTGNKGTVPVRALTFFPVQGEYEFRYDKKSNTLFGSTTGHSQDHPVNFKMYFAVCFDPDTVCEENSRPFSVDNHGCGFHIFFRVSDICARIGISYLSEEQALYAIQEDISDKSFEEVRAEAEERWESILSRIEIEPYDEEQMKTFYSCLYRACLFPHKAYEHDAETGENVHYSPFDGQKKHGVRYTDNGFWDTYRTVFPLYAVIARKEYAEMLDGFVADYRDGGWLPRWPSIGEVGCMPSTLIDAVIADAAVKGIGTRKVLTDAFKGMINHANHNGPENRYGRNGVEMYCKLGYMPCNRYSESVNLTLDSAYGDYCIARVAEVLGYDKSFIDNYDRRSKNYQKLFDPQTGFMRGRDENGKMSEYFDPLDWGGDYTEGCAWQSSFAVPHDIAGLAALYGGREAFEKKLDELFSAKPDYRVGSYGMEIHEMTEMASADFGQCAISNQPSFHLPFLYSMIGREDKASCWVKKLCTAFSSANDGYPGDEDNGATSSWYIFASLGIYPVCPGMPATAGYAKTKMLVKSAKILWREWNNDNIASFIFPDTEEH